MNPAVGLLRSLPIIQPGKAPGMLQACQKSRISQRRTNIWVRFQIHSAPSPTITTMVFACPASPVRGVGIQMAEDVVGIPRQLTRKRRTTEWRPGEVSTLSLGNSSTPVLISASGLLPQVARAEGSRSPGAAGAVYAPACPTCCHPTLSTTTGGASRVEAPSLRLSAWY